jgi:peroxiredoxin
VLTTLQRWRGASLISPVGSLTVLSALCNFARLARAYPVRREGSLLSWQLPDGPARYETARRAGIPLRLCVLALILATWLPSQAEPGYSLTGRPAPDFALHAASGGNVRLSEHIGQVVVLSFWSSRCNPCRTQLAALNRSLATYRAAGLTVYGVGVDDDQDKSLEFARSVQVAFPLLLDPQKAVARSYQVDNLPMTVLIDRNGTVRHALRDYDGQSAQLYLQQLRELLNE